jgi:hypothetical protein
MFHIGLDDYIKKFEETRINKLIDEALDDFKHKVVEKIPQKSYSNSKGTYYTTYGINLKEKNQGIISTISGADYKKEREFYLLSLNEKEKICQDTLTKELTKEEKEKFIEDLPSVPLTSLQCSHNISLTSQLQEFLLLQDPLDFTSSPTEVSEFPRSVREDISC